MRTKTWMTALALASLAMAACKREAPPAAPPRPPPAPAPAPAPPPEEPVLHDESVRPVYPPLEGEPPALARRLCAALHDLPEERRAACCQVRPALVMTSECLRMVGGAVASGAVRLAEEDVAACEAAQAAQHAGCEHVGPWPLPAAPACQGILRGARAAGEPCRSSLECADGLRCRGVGPTEAGRCAPPGAIGEPCGGRVDPLATMARQLDVAEAHPECKDTCGRHRCEPVRALGAACERSGQCGRDARCEDGACVAGASIPPGGRCSGAGCAAGTRCLAGTCTAPRPAGEPCAADLECMGGCVGGRCGQRCDLR